MIVSAVYCSVLQCVLCRARTEAQSLVTNVTGLVDQRCSQLVTEGGRLCSQVMASAN